MDACAEDLTKDLWKLQGEVRTLREALTQVEWCDTDGIRATCPLCTARYSDKAHKPGCLIGAALSSSPAPTGATAMKQPLQIPPMPDPDDFRDYSDYLSETEFVAALAAWERVAKHVIEHHYQPTSQESGGHQP